MAKREDDPEIPRETREQYCERIRRQNNESDEMRLGEQRRREGLERFGPRLDALSAEELDALARVALTEFAYRYFSADRSRARRWLIRKPLLTGLSRMLAAEASEAERQELF